MNVSHLLWGLGLAVFGVAFLTICRWYVRDDRRLRDMANSRWGWDRVTQRRLRKGEMSQEAWFSEFASGQRMIVKWGLTPFMVLWLGLCVVMIVDGLLGK